MTLVQAIALTLVGLGAVAVAFTRDTARLVLVSSLYALLLVVLFVLLQAPDVALSALVVGTIASPLILLVAVAKERGA